MKRSARATARDTVVRAVFPGPQLVRSDDEDPAFGGMPRMVGHFTKFDEWTEINSKVEGHFMERFRPGSFTKTIREGMHRMKVLFNHGRDPSIGMKVMGSIRGLEEDDDGPAYDVQLHDTSFNRDLIPGLEAGEYGASFRFGVVKGQLVRRPAKSEWNPMGLPEHSVEEAYVPEFGAVTFPAYAGATAGLRSLTDHFVLADLVEGDPELEAVVGHRVKGILVPDLGGGWRDAETGNDAARDAQLLSSIRTNVTLDRVVDAPDENVRYHHITEYVSATPWAIHPQSLATIVKIVEERNAGAKLTPDEIKERIGTSGAERAEEDTAGPVAVIAVHGPIVPRADLFSEMSGMTSVQSVKRKLKAALDDSDVSAIVLDFDTPGGSVDLVPELASMIFEARGEKPIVGVANTWAASAGYWLISQCDEVVVTPSGEVGSIGVYTAHQDISGAMEQAGVDMTLVAAGKYKVERNPFEPLSEEAESEMQRGVDAFYGMFVNAVAKGRGVKGSVVRAEFGEGRMVMATEAVERGMADRVATLEQTVARLEKAATKTAGRNAAGATEPVVEPEPPATTPDVTEPEPSEATTPPPAASAQRSASEHNAQEEASDMDAYKTLEEKASRIGEIEARLHEINSDYAGEQLPQSVDEEWNALLEEKAKLERDVKAAEERRKTLENFSVAPANRDLAPVGGERSDDGYQRGSRRSGRSWDGDVYDLSNVRMSILNPEGHTSELRDRARFAIEAARFPHPEADREQVQGHVERMLFEADTDALLARHILLTGSPMYMRAFGKALQGAPMTREEQSAMSLAAASVRAMSISGSAGAAGGFAVPYTLDPTVILTSDGVVNPIRAISDVEQIVGNEWRGVTSAGVTASYAAEAAEVDDDSPTLAQPTINVERADAFVPFSIELGQDWSGLQSTLARLIQAAKDDLEAVKFLTGAGHGSNEPQGVLTGLSTTQRVLTESGNAFADDDVYNLDAAMPPRFTTRSSILGAKGTFHLVRQFDANGGAALWERIGAGMPPELLGHPARELSSMSSTVAEGEKILLQGDFGQGYKIIERVGMTVEIVQHLFGDDRRPTGQRGLLALWRNSAEVIVPNAFRYLEVLGT